MLNPLLYNPLFGKPHVKNWHFIQQNKKLGNNTPKNTKHYVSQQNKAPLAQSTIKLSPEFCKMHRKQPTQKKEQQDTYK